MIEQKKKIVNWPEYTRSLKQRGSLEIWIDEKVKDKWKAKATGKRGGQIEYSEFAIQTTLMIGKVFNQRLRQTEGLVESIIKIMGLDLQVPDYTTLSKRGRKLEVDLQKEEKGIVRILLDSTGLKVYGEGEWKVRKHGASKRRTWKKMHIGIDEDNEVRMVEVTSNGVDDAETSLVMMKQEKSKIKSIKGDGAYDNRKVYEEFKPLTDEIIIPPRKGARIWKHGNRKGEKLIRDENVREVRKKGLKEWKKERGYHKRSLVETFMYRYKIIFTDKLHARKEGQQSTEASIGCAVLNVMKRIGMPKYLLV